MMDADKSRGNYIGPNGGKTLMSSLVEGPEGWLESLEADPSNRLLAGAVDDGLIAKNPCAAETVTKPKVPKRTIQPWPTERVFAMSTEPPERYAIMMILGAGCGLRQGEISGLAVDDVDFDEGLIHVRRQVKLIQGQQLFGLPEHDRERTVPLPTTVAEALKVIDMAFGPAAPGTGTGSEHGAPQ